MTANSCSKSKMLLHVRPPQSSSQDFTVSKFEKKLLFFWKKNAMETQLLSHQTWTSLHVTAWPHETEKWRPPNVFQDVWMSCVSKMFPKKKWLLCILLKKKADLSTSLIFNSSGCNAIRLLSFSSSSILVSASKKRPSVAHQPSVTPQPRGN